MDDILIFGSTREELHNKTMQILQRLKDNDLYLKPEKCMFSQEKVEYLGLIVSKDHLQMDPAKLTGIKDWPTPTKKKDVQRFLGFANFYRRFIDHYADIARPLDGIKQSNKPWEWTPECDEAFQTLKKSFLNKPILLMPDKSKPFVLETDVSKVASGAVLR